MDQKKLKFLRGVGNAETTSFLALLLIGTPLKWLAQIPEPTRYIGAFHGCLFLMYGLTLLTSRRALRLSYFQVVVGLLLSCVPFGPWLFEKRVICAPEIMKTDSV